VGQNKKNISFYLFFLPGPFQGGHFFPSNNLFCRNETPLPKPPLVLRPSPPHTTCSNRAVGNVLFGCWLVWAPGREGGYGNGNINIWPAEGPKPANDTRPARPAEGAKKSPLLCCAYLLGGGVRVQSQELWALCAVLCGLGRGRAHEGGLWHDNAAGS
jgi:hypothetical protein